jgi:shikimate kinase
MTERDKSIVLIGFMGAGKSAVGRCLARLTGLPRFDTDEMIANDFGLPVAQIFAKHGEEAFRDAETKMLRRLRGESDSITVTGGGVVLRPENFELLKKLGFVVHLEADEKTLFRRLMRQPTRPLIQTANPRATVKKLLKERAPLYRAAADMALLTSNLGQQEVAKAILRKMEVLRSESK